MAYDYPYRVERCRWRSDDVPIRWAIVRTGDDELCTGDDVVFLHRLIDLLNEEELVTAIEGR
jgi:hypothetical protein